MTCRCGKKNQNQNLLAVFFFFFSRLVDPESVGLRSNSNQRRMPALISLQAAEKERFNHDITTQDMLSIHGAITQKKLCKRCLPASQIKQQMLQWLNKIDLGQHRNISTAKTKYILKWTQLNRKDNIHSPTYPIKSDYTDFLKSSNILEQRNTSFH